MTPDLDVAVVGAGIAGLTAAHELQRSGLAVRVYEAEPHVGGRMASFRYEGYTIDQGAEQISPRGYRATWELLRRLGVPLDEIPLIGKSIGMWRGGRAHPGVAERGALLTGAGLSARARLDLARFLAWASRRRREFDPDHPEATPAGEATVAAFARRYHPDLHDYLFQPVAGSFFGWDTTRSAAASMLSLLVAVGDAASWRTYRDGMDTLALRLARELDVAVGRMVGEVVADRDFARLSVGGEVVTARTVLLCVPAPIAARLHANPPPSELAFLRACTFTPALKVSCLLDRPLEPESSRPLYVLLTPEAEDDVLSGIIVDHAKHPGRAPAGRGLLSLMASARTIPSLLEAPEQEVVARLTNAVPRYLPGFGAANVANFVHGFRYGLPEATPAALRARAGFMARPVGSVDYAGDWVMLRPASEGAVRAGVLAASRTLSRLGTSRPATRTAA
ncbi:FAD-dependent oxidoreductase [Saccharopolyspora erythraea]|uniref:protoporphyrinogen/coproporphyrinogen oxidase n=1 Tax=Saccharopolyspora erythraea TaxID=1836 RepID=UPI001BA789FE|nr:NAD(P)/FAD-dependent oxidoreductase [Saccharopolyspora erythraea]QUH03296.1 FAD-dependent oxidoreductase [Saccharopolyspora erythraea]